MLKNGDMEDLKRRFWKLEDRVRALELVIKSIHTSTDDIQPGPEY